MGLGRQAEISSAHLKTCFSGIMTNVIEGHGAAQDFGFLTRVEKRGARHSQGVVQVNFLKRFSKPPHWHIVALVSSLIMFESSSVYSESYINRRLVASWSFVVMKIMAERNHCGEWNSKNGKAVDADEMLN
ncbi:hypothetical protein CEXT_100851 [Caerostris extrusa]|uniref:Uncharacterized protein n=1 Tax=Caerostris extrusa TaxID=172846 RepID=A0AAV4MEX5_CAEEX|nr:hypothetical protein CEXT_100851 [Caerostris extrusa]